MEKTIKKSAKKVAKKAIRAAQGRTLINATPEAWDAMVQRAIKNQEQALLDGKDAYANLCKLKNGKLPRGVEEILAKRLHAELPQLFSCLKANGLSKAEFCSRYGLNDGNETSKELNRLTIAPGAKKDEVKARRLRRTADKYRRLIDGIQSQTGVNKSQMVDRLFRGTPLHPIKQMEQFSKAENVMNALQGIVDCIDREFGLYEKFMEVDRLKAVYRAEGSKENWPLSDDSDLDDVFGVGSGTGSTGPADADSTRHFDNGFHEFWERRNLLTGESAIDWNHDTYFPRPEFFYVPHVKLGWVDCWIPVDQKATPAEFAKAKEEVLKEVRAPRVDLKKSIASIVASYQVVWDNKTMAPVETNSEGWIGESNVFWLVIFPSIDKSRLVPWLHTAGEFPYLIPLSVRTLEEFRDAIWADEANESSFLDRIVNLIGYRTGQTRVIEEALRATAPWLDHNPIFKLRNAQAQADADDAEMMRRYLAELRQDGDA